MRGSRRPWNLLTSVKPNGAEDYALPLLCWLEYRKVAKRTRSGRMKPQSRQLTGLEEVSENPERSRTAKLASNHKRLATRRKITVVFWLLDTVALQGNVRLAYSVGAS
jgi:hypothetical protein